MCKRDWLAAACLGLCTLAESWSPQPVVSIKAACCTLCSKALNLPYKTHQEGLTTVESNTRSY